MFKVTGGKWYYYSWVDRNSSCWLCYNTHKIRHINCHPRGLTLRHILVQPSQLSANNSNFPPISTWHGSHFQSNSTFPETALSAASKQTLFILSSPAPLPAGGHLAGPGPRPGGLQAARLPERQVPLGAARGCWLLRPLAPLTVAPSSLSLRCD